MKLPKLIVASLAPLAVACGNLQSNPEPPAFGIDPRHVIDMARQALTDADSVFYADQWVADAIAVDTTVLWLTPNGVIASADSLLARLIDIDAEGINPAFYGAADLQARIDTVRAWADTGRHHLLTDTLAAAIEADLTQALLRYVYGQRYGYLLPNKIYNNLLVDYDAPAGRKRPYRQLTDMPYDVPTDSLAAVAIACLRRDSIATLLADIQPTHALHRLCAERYRRAVADGDTAMALKARVNLERCRWHYLRPDTGMYVLVNLAAQQLRAVDTRRDSCLEMRICLGNNTHKSPMLASKINYIELNPYWVVPMSILRNEMATIHLNDTAYYRRNNMRVIDNSTGDMRDPATLSAKEWTSGRYTLRQDKGAGNSLGRIIFRFPNIFSVFLHDTNNPGAFNRDRRTVSHGCIRVQQPLNLATFLLADADPLYIDRLRISIDKPALTEKGRALGASAKLSRCDLRHPVPLWIDYYTLYPDYHGQLQEYPDIYGYDDALAAALAAIHNF